MSESFTKNLNDYKNRSNTIWRSDKYRFGDLYGISYHPGFQIPLTNNATYPRAKCNTQNKAIDLYALCDSYVWQILPSDTFYCNVNKFRFATVNYFDRLLIKLDSTKKNILFIEFSERNTRFMLQEHFDYMTEFLKISNSSHDLIPPVKQTDPLLNRIFNKNINTNLELNLFEMALFTPLKKWKGALKFGLLKMTDENVALGPDGKYLLFQPTLDPVMNTSSFKPISDGEIDTSVNKLNAVYFQYKNMGFDEVYFTIIPNPVTILYPRYNGYVYNHLIERLEKHPARKIPMINVYEDFNNAKFPVFFASDSHWNMDGAYIWLNKLNTILARVSR